MIQHLLQGKWGGAGDEPSSFFGNSTVGLAGFFDVAENWKIPKSDADFGQTFGQWGWNPACYLMLPIFGPSNERDFLGFAADTAANPLIYTAAYAIRANHPVTDLGPNAYSACAARCNTIADTVVD